MLAILIVIAVPKFMNFYFICIVLTALGFSYRSEVWWLHVSAAVGP